MNDDQLKGKAKNLKGRVKEAAGSLVGDHRLEGEGLADRAKGAAQKTFGDAKEGLEEPTERKRAVDVEDDDEV